MTDRFEERRKCGWTCCSKRSTSSITERARTKSGSFASIAGSSPARRKSSSEKKRIDSTPPARFCQNWAVLRAPDLAVISQTNPQQLSQVLDSSENTELAEMMLGGRYAYLNPTLDRFIAEDDTNPADLSYLKSQAAKVDISHASNVARQYWS